MLVVVTGAGASTDAVPAGGDPSCLPPVARRLFGEEYEHLMDAVGVPPGLAAKFRSGASVEEELDALDAEAQRDHAAAARLTAIRLYVRELMALASRGTLRRNRRTNFDRLVDALKAWQQARAGEPILFVTFNYDTLLDRAVESAYKLSFRTLADYWGGGLAPIRVFKLHGSWNWLRLTSWSAAPAGGGRRERRRALIDATTRYDLPQDFGNHIVTSSMELFRDGRWYYPAVALPTDLERPLSESVMGPPDTYGTLWRTMQAEISAVLSIGWRGRDREYAGALAS